MVSPLDTNVKGADPRNYGRAKRASLWVRPYGSTDDAAWDEIGNLVDLAAVPDLTKLEHKSNRRGDLVRDRIEYTERKMTLDVKLDEVKTSNLMKAFGASISKQSGSATVREGRIVTNPGDGGSVDLAMVAIDSLIVRSTNEEGSVTTFVKAVAADFATDSTDPTQGGDFNVTTNPLVLATAVSDYADVTFAVGLLIKIESEILQVTAVSGTSVTFARGQNFTTIAVHADGTNLFTATDVKDYSVDSLAGTVAVLAGGDLADESTVPEFHVYMTKDVDTETFEMFDGSPIKLEAEYQVLTEKGARIIMDLPAVVVTNKGSITFGQGDKWIEMPLELDVLANSSGKVGFFHVIQAAEVL